MSISNLFNENGYNLYCNTLTSKQVISENKPPVTTINGICVTTTIENAGTENGTPNFTVAEIGLSIEFFISNGVCFLYKKGSSGSFPDADQSADLKINLGSVNKLYLLAKIPNSTKESGGIFFPPNTFPVCDSNQNPKTYYGMANCIFPLKETSGGPVSSIFNPVQFNFYTLNDGSQYFDITIPRHYDYINASNEYTEQKFSSQNADNIIPPFYIQYPTPN